MGGLARSGREEGMEKRWEATKEEGSNGRNQRERGWKEKGGVGEEEEEKEERRRGRGKTYSHAWLCQNSREPLGYEMRCSGS